MRERRATASGALVLVRITPACAGKTLVGWFVISLVRDHPRVCGKDPIDIVCTPTILGSPPRVRERHNKEERKMKIERITPACAGKTYLRTVAHDSPRDHPRVCGKDSARFSVIEIPSGSPPRVRERLDWNVRPKAFKVINQSFPHTRG